MLRDQQNSRFWGLPSFLVLMVVNIVILIFSTNTMLLSPKSMGMSIMSFFQKGIHGGIGWMTGTINSVNELKDLKNQYDLTLEKLNEYQQMDRNFQEIIRENELLHKQLELSQEMEVDHLSAKIIAKDPVNLFSSFIINKGIGDGVARGMPVTAYQDGIIGLVGKVIQAGVGSSQVIPIYNSTSYVAARFQHSRYEGLIGGLGDTENHLIMNYVQKTALPRIKVDDMIITSGMQSLYPGGISIGKVENITSREYNTSLEITVSPVIDFGRLEYVFVLTGNEENFE